MKDLGLAYDPNVAVKIPKRQKVTRKDVRWIRFCCCVRKGLTEKIKVGMMLI